MTRHERLLLVLAWLAVGAVLLARPRDYGLAPGHHGYLSAHGAAIAKNLGSAHGLLMFERQSLARCGEKPRPVAYSRFPQTSFALIAAAMGLAGQAPAQELAAARALMLLFFLAAMICAFLTLRRILGRSLVALGATLFAFSGWYLAFYGDMIFNDLPALFGLLLAFDGVVSFEQHRRRGQLYFKGLLAVSLGMQPLALLAAYALLSLLRARWGPRTPAPPRARHAIGVSAVALLLSLAILGGNLLHERQQTGLPWAKLESIESLQRRAGLDARWSGRWAAALRWDAFGQQQLRRVLRMALPHTESLRPARVNGRDRGSLVEALGGVAVLALALLLLRGEPRFLFGVVLLAGFAWALPMRHFTAFHDFQSLYYIGSPLALYGALLGWLGTRAPRLLPLAVFAALACFANAHRGAIRFQRQLSRWAHAEQLSADFAAIRQAVPPGQVVWLGSRARRLGGVDHAVDFYLARRIFSSERTCASFILSDDPQAAKASLTPTNHRVFVRSTPASTSQTSPPKTTGPRGHP